MEPGRAAERQYSRASEHSQPRANIRANHENHWKGALRYSRPRDSRGLAPQQQQQQQQQQLVQPGQYKPLSSHNVNAKQQALNTNNTSWNEVQQGRYCSIGGSSSGAPPGMSHWSVDSNRLAQITNAHGRILPDPSLASSLAESFERAYWLQKQKPAGVSPAASPVPMQMCSKPQGTPQFDITAKEATANTTTTYQRRTLLPINASQQLADQLQQSRLSDGAEKAKQSYEHWARAELTPAGHSPPPRHQGYRTSTSSSYSVPQSAEPAQVLLPSGRVQRVEGATSTQNPATHRRVSSAGAVPKLSATTTESSQTASVAQQHASQPTVSNSAKSAAGPTAAAQYYQSAESSPHQQRPAATTQSKPEQPPSDHVAPRQPTTQPQGEDGQDPVANVEVATQLDTKAAPSSPLIAEPTQDSAPAAADSYTPAAVATEDKQLPTQPTPPDRTQDNASVAVSESLPPQPILDSREFPPLPQPAGGVAATAPTPTSPIPLDVQRDALSKLLETVDVFDHQVPTWVFEESIPHKGMENKGQICYIIAAVQSLMDVAPGLYRAIYRAHQLLLEAQEIVVEHGIQAEENGGRREIKDGKAKGIPFLVAHQPMLESYFDPTVQVVAATRMQQIGRAVLKDFQMGQQEDAVEFLCSYLLRLNQELKTLQLAAKDKLLGKLLGSEPVVEGTWHVPGKKGKRSSLLEGQQRIQQQHTTIADAVWGITSYAEYKSSKTSRCSQLQLYYILMLPLTRSSGSPGGSSSRPKQLNGSNGKQNGGKTGNGGGSTGGKGGAPMASGGTLQGLVDSYFAEQQVEDRHQQDTVEEAKLGHAPKILMAQLLRFTYTNAYKQVKLNDPIHVSGEIQMPYQHSRVKYKLRSVIMHAGNSVDYGHYYVTLKQPGSPKVLDDQLIGDKPRSSNRGDAYIITYVRCDG